MIEEAWLVTSAEAFKVLLSLRTDAYSLYIEPLLLQANHRRVGCASISASDTSASSRML